jgi:hypothetical protein
MPPNPWVRETFSSGLSDPDHPCVLDVFHEPVPSGQFYPIILVTASRPKIFSTGWTDSKPATLILNFFHNFKRVSEFFVYWGLYPLRPFRVDQISAFKRHPDIYLSPSLIGDRLSQEEAQYGSVRVIATMSNNNNIFSLLIILCE